MKTYLHENFAKQYLHIYLYCLLMQTHCRITYFARSILVNYTYIYIYILKQIRTDEQLYNCNYCLANPDFDENCYIFYLLKSVRVVIGLLTFWELFRKFL
jgi:hypothetical protein